MDVDDIIKEICKVQCVEIHEVTKKSKVRKYSDIRKAIVLICNEYSDTTVTELAHKLNIPASMVSKIRTGGAKRTEYMDSIIERFEEKIKTQA